MTDFSTHLPLSEFLRVPACASDGSTLEFEEQVAEDLAVDDWMNAWMAQYEQPAFAGVSQLWRTAALSTSETEVVAAAGNVGALLGLLAQWRRNCSAGIETSPGEFAFLRPIVEEVRGIEERLAQGQTEALQHSAKNLEELTERLFKEAVGCSVPSHRATMIDMVGSLNLFVIAMHVQRGDHRAALAFIERTIPRLPPDLQGTWFRGPLGQETLPQIIRAEEGTGYRLFAEGDFRAARDAFSHALRAYQLLAQNPKIDVSVAKKRVKLMRDALLYHAEGKVNFPEALEGDLIMKTFAASNLQTALYQYFEIIKIWPLSMARSTTASAYFCEGLAKLCLDLAQLVTGKERKKEYRLKAGRHFADAVFIFLPFEERTESERLLDLAIKVLPDEPWAEVEELRNGDSPLRADLALLLDRLLSENAAPRFKKAVELWQDGGAGAATAEAHEILVLLGRGLAQLEGIKRTLLPESPEQGVFAQVKMDLCCMAANAAYLTGDEALKTQYREQAMATALQPRDLMLQRFGRFQAVLPPTPLEGVAPELVDTPLLAEAVLPFVELLEEEMLGNIVDAHPQGRLTLRHLAAYFRNQGMISLEMEGELAENVRRAIERGIPVTPDSVMMLYVHLSLSDEPRRLQDPVAVAEFLEAWPRRREIIERDRGGGGFKEDPRRRGGRRPGGIP